MRERISWVSDGHGAGECVRRCALLLFSMISVLTFRHLPPSLKGRVHEISKNTGFQVTVAVISRGKGCCSGCSFVYLCPVLSRVGLEVGGGRRCVSTTGKQRESKGDLSPNLRTVELMFAQHFHSLVSSAKINLLSLTTRLGGWACFEEEIESQRDSRLPPRTQQKNSHVSFSVSMYVYTHTCTCAPTHSGILLSNKKG